MKRPSLRFLITSGILLFLLVFGISVGWSYHVASARVQHFNKILLTIASLPIPPAIAEPVPTEAPDVDALANLPDSTPDPAHLRRLRTLAASAHQMILDYLPVDSPAREKLLADWPAADTDALLRAFIDDTRAALASEYARRSADALAQQINATLTPDTLDLLKKFPSPNSTRAFDTLNQARELHANDPLAAAPLYRAVLASLAPALQSAHQAQNNAQLNQLQTFAQKALANNTPLLAVVPLRTLILHRPDDAAVRDLLARAETALSDHLQRYFLLRFNAEEADAFKKLAATTRQAATTKEPLCLATLALSLTPPDLAAVTPLLPALQQLADAGSVPALYLLALHHENADASLPVLDAASPALYLRAAELNFLPAFLPAALYLIDQSENTHSTNNQAITLLTAAANANHPAAQRELGFLYLNGRAGIEKNSALAHHWFAKAANRGDPRAQTSIGLLLLEGRGAEQNPQAALYWFRQAANRNDPVALYNLGLLALRRIPSNATESDAARYIRQAAEAGFAPAQRYLAGFHAEGRLNFPKDPILAYQWAAKSAAQNDPPGLLFLGLLQSNGIGTPTNKTAAALSILKAANLRYPEAMYALGLLYADGEGLPQNPDKAREWVTRAADAGYPPATDWIKANP